MSVAAGWYPDPAQPDRLRWWDGQQWTDHVRAAAPATVAPVSVAAPVAQPVAPLPTGTTVGVTSAQVGYGAFDPSPASSSTAILPAHSAGRLAPDTHGWQRPAVAAVLIGVLAVGGVLGYRALTSSASPAVMPTSPALAAPLDARTAGTILDTFKPHDDTPEPGVTSILVPKGDTLGTPTLADWCGAASHTDQTRIARRQWMFVRAGKTIGSSVEVAAYATSAQAKAAFDEFVAINRSCSVKVLHAPKGTVTFRRLSVIDESPGPGIQSQSALLQEDAVVAATKQKLRGWATGAVQQRGQIVVIVWSGQQAKYTDADLAVLRGIAQHESLVLGMAPLS